MEWTKELPKIEGYYWVRYKPYLTIDGKWKQGKEFSTDLLYLEHWDWSEHKDTWYTSISGSDCGGPDINEEWMEEHPEVVFAGPLEPPSLSNHNLKGN